MRQSWLGIGVLTAGVGLQLLAGATAWADSDTAADPGRPAAASGDEAKPKPAAERPHKPKAVDAEADSADPTERPTGRPVTASETDSDGAKPDTDGTKADAEADDAKADGAEADEPDDAGAVTADADTPPASDPATTGVGAGAPVQRDGDDHGRPTPRDVHARRGDAAIPPDSTHDAGTPAGPPSTGGGNAESATAAAEQTVSAVPAAARTVVTLSTTGTDTAAEADEAAQDTATAAIMSAAVATSAAGGSGTNIIGAIVGLVFSVITALERWVVGPPTVPAGSSVSVRSSSLQLTDSLSVPADWYFPAATETGQAPERIVFLAHGFFAVGAMYSYTAARLAEDTDSIVVVPTVTSNPFAPNGLWINGPALRPVVADLFTGDRAALTESALAAGYAEQYGLSAVDAELPRMFALAGHSAGGALVSGVIGYLVDNGAVDDLAGVVLLDAVTSGDTLTDSLAKLDDYQQQTGRFVPVREIGSPKGLWNFPSNVNASLESARPDSFGGVVLDRGTHADAIQGGGPLIQWVIRLLVGNALPQNVDALQGLAATWLNAWFDGTDRELVPGSTVTGAATVTIPTPAGPATGSVIGATPDVTSANRELELAAAV